MSAPMGWTPYYAVSYTPLWLFYILPPNHHPTTRGEQAEAKTVLSEELPLAETASQTALDVRSPDPCEQMTTCATSVISGCATAVQVPSKTMAEGSILSQAWHDDDSFIEAVLGLVAAGERI